MSIPVGNDIIEDVNHFLVIELFLTANKRQIVKATVKSYCDFTKCMFEFIFTSTYVTHVVKFLLEFMTGTKRHGMI